MKWPSTERLSLAGVRFERFEHDYEKPRYGG